MAGAAIQGMSWVKRKVPSARGGSVVDGEVKGEEEGEEGDGEGEGGLKLAAVGEDGEDGRTDEGGEKDDGEDVVVYVHGLCQWTGELTPGLKPLCLRFDL